MDGCICKFREYVPDRSGLYIMVFIIMINSCDTDSKVESNLKHIKTQTEISKRIVGILEKMSNVSEED